MMRWLRAQPAPWEVEPDDGRTFSRWVLVLLVAGVPAIAGLRWVLDRLVNWRDAEPSWWEALVSALPVVAAIAWLSWCLSWHAKRRLDDARRDRALPVRDLPTWLPWGVVLVVAAVIIGAEAVVPQDGNGLGRGAGVPRAIAYLLIPAFVAWRLDSRIMASPRNKARLRAEADRLRADRSPAAPAGNGS